MGRMLDTYIDAVTMATEAHHGQVRKFSNTPYVLHPIRVSRVVHAHTDSIEMASAAVLHDVLEDTNVTADTMRAKFGDYITDLVISVTKNKALPKHQREEEFLARFRRSMQDTVLIKLWDRFDNLHDMNTNSTLVFKVGYLRNTWQLMSAVPEWTGQLTAVVAAFGSVFDSFAGAFMAVKTLTEADGTVVFSKQSDEWLKERLQGVTDTLKGSSSPSPTTITDFLAISKELEARFPKV